MEVFVVFLLIGLVALFIYLFYRRANDKKMIATDDLFSQRGVTVQFKAGTITINKYTYAVNDVSSVTLVTYYGSGNSYHVQIDVDDMNHPIHKIAIVGTEKTAREFAQRICLAIQQAGRSRPIEPKYKTEGNY